MGLLGSAVALADGSVIAASTGPQGGALTRFSEKGDILWETAFPWSEFGGQAWPNPNAILDGRGNLYVMPAPHILVFQADASPANSGWPMWFGDWRNSGHPEPLPGTELPTELGLYLSNSAEALTLVVSAPPDVNWVLQASPDLIGWTNLMTQQTTLEIPAAALQSKQFFRVLRR